ncbi:hypothetical protein [Flavobacterium suzhouense]|uniref:DUF922 domain-containing protein n=1 Tax=Flavobacterium suzhouense TaxID=1529638 RepID=A0ABW5NR23_9FLAO
MKFILFNLLAISMLSIPLRINKNSEDDKILWSSTKRLKWDDFKGMANDTLDTHVAQTQGSIEIVRTEIYKNIPKITLHCYFIKSLSWTKVDDIETLNHEQLHFDIYELFTRKIRKAFNELNRKNISDINEYQKVYNLYIEKCNAFNELYDHEVYFNEKKQLMWNLKIEQELKKLKDFEYIDI